MSNVAAPNAGRIAEAPADQVESIFGPGAQGQVRLLAQSPPIAAALAKFMGAVYHDTTLPRRMVELVRIRVSFHSQCRTCMATRNPVHGVDEDLVCQLETPAEAEGLTDAERAAMKYADLLATNHQAINDETYDELRKFFDERQIVELGLLISSAHGLGKLFATWSHTEELPEYFQVDFGTATLTPWGTDKVLVPSNTTGGKAEIRAPF